MEISPELYKDMVDRVMPKSKSYMNIPKAFLIGGAICLLGECLLNLYGSMGLDKEAAGSWTSVTLVFLSALLTGLGWYERIAKHAGAGTLVPITGFANGVTAPAIEARTEGWILGVGAKIFTIAGPVLLYGTAASVIYGIFLMLFG
ncbi:MAG: stage V sporulation protein AC [Oscillospiraceae bacterium]|nr:stage V sporulation protein AC [Oscillospiraceae bacterium]